MIAYKFVAFRFGTGTSNTSNRSPLNSLPFLIRALFIVLLVNEDVMPLKEVTAFNQYMIISIETGALPSLEREMTCRTFVWLDVGIYALVVSDLLSAT